jgi:hypothetical protein
MWVFGKKKYEALKDSMKPGDSLVAVHYWPLPLYKITIIENAPKRRKK